jgi:hypothetical protein
MTPQTKFTRTLSFGSPAKAFSRRLAPLMTEPNLSSSTNLASGKRRNARSGPNSVPVGLPTMSFSVADISIFIVCNSSGLVGKQTIPISPFNFSITCAQVITPPTLPWRASVPEPSEKAWSLSVPTKPIVNRPTWSVIIFEKSNIHASFQTVLAGSRGPKIR